MKNILTKNVTKITLLMLLVIAGATSSFGQFQEFYLDHYCKRHDPPFQENGRNQGDVCHFQPVQLPCYQSRWDRGNFCSPITILPTQPTVCMQWVELTPVEVRTGYCMSNTLPPSAVTPEDPDGHCQYNEPWHSIANKYIDCCMSWTQIGGGGGGTGGGGQNLTP